MKILRQLLSILLVITAATAVNAQTGVGSWKVFGSFVNVDKIVDTPDYVYYLSTDQLYSYDKEYQETQNISTSSRLTDNEITDLYYNYDNKSIVVIYNNANIDVIDREGRVHNMPDIKDAALDVVPAVNDVAFDGDKIYVATNFGLVVFNATKYEVITARNFGKDITNVVVLGDKVWIVENGFGYSGFDKDINLSSIKDLNDFNNGNHNWTTEIIKLNDNVAVIINEHRYADNGAKGLVLATKGENGLLSFSNIAVDTTVKNLHLMKDGSISAHGNNTYYVVKPDGTLSKTAIGGTPLAYTVNGIADVKNIAGWNGTGELWVGNEAGLTCYDLAAPSTPVVSSVMPEAGLTLQNTAYLWKGPSGAIYVSNYGLSVNYKNIANDKLETPFVVNRIKNGEIEDLTPLECTHHHDNLRFDKDPIGFKGGYMVKELPGDPDSYMIGSGSDGMYVFKDRREVVNYYTDNSSMQLFDIGQVRTTGFDFDRNGNLWVCILVPDGYEKNAGLHVLSADKVGKETVKEDWQSIVCGRETEHDGKMVACKHSNNVAYIDRLYKGSIVIIHTQGTSTVDDDELIISSMISDQDGLVYSYNNIYSIVEDHRGHLWIGTDDGVIEIPDPDAIDSSTFKVNRIKVPRNDGTNFADYLLGGEMVTSIAVDPSNRKWLTTFNSGVYLVSENGDEILEHFDITNSPLPTNMVFSCVCGDNNEVYFATLKGTLMYRSDSAPAADNYSNVYAYPNPVRPEYNGWITITGLMDNSLVKIADAAGNVFYQGNSEGGMMIWDGCDSQGRRVKTGVYYVFASQSGDGQSNNGAVTKILVVN